MKPPVPSKSDIALLEPFIGLTLQQIHVPTDHAGFAAAAAAIHAAGIVGFDTESKPTFAVGETSDGPHVVQFALHDRAYLFQVHRTAGHPFLLDLLQSERLLKVGFGLRSDRKHVLARFGVHFDGVVDLNSVFSARGYQKEMGVRNAVGLVLQQRFAKSKKVTTTNWAQHALTEQQILYAANDAYAALKVLEALRLPREALPVMGASQQEEVADNRESSE